MSKTKFDETFVFKISIKPNSFNIYVGIKIRFLDFRLLLSRVAPYLQFVTTNCLKRGELGGGG